MKRNLIYLLVLIVLGFITYYFVFKEHEETFPKSEANFMVEDTDEIETIFLSSLHGENLKFTKKGSEWVINDSIEIVQTLVQDLLQALREQRAVQPVRLSFHDQVIREMSSNSSKVEIYTKEGKTHTFYVAQNAAPDNLTYMLTDGAKRPYVVKLPMQNIFLGIRYNTKLSNWRSRKIMYAKADDIESIDVRYTDSIHYSFQLKVQEGKTPIVSGSKIIETSLNEKRVQAYLGMWDSLYCLGYETRNKIKDTIFSSGKKLADITLRKKDKTEQTLALYFKPVSKGTKGMLDIGGEKYDFDVFIGWLNNRDMIVITRNYAQIMLRSYPEFYEAN